MCHTAAACCLLLVAIFAASANAFEFRRCGGNNVLDISNVRLSPSPLVFPGPMKFDLRMQLKQQTANIDLKIGLAVGLFGIYVPLPCVSNIGSCNYGDVCSALDRMEKENWGGVGSQLANAIRTLLGDVDGGTDNTCPFVTRDIDVKDESVTLPSIPPQLANIAAGDYRVRFELRETASKEMMSCFEMDIGLKRGD